MKDFFSMISLLFRPFFGGTLEEGIKAYDEFALNEKVEGDN